jgi:hypothetical protein
MMRTPSTTPVILNLFQDPFLRTRRSVVGKRGGAVVLSSAATGNAARWVLKQVQDDEEERVAA